MMNLMETIEQVINACISNYTTPDARMFPVFDRERGHFLVVEEGWLAEKHLHTVFVHIELREGKIWILQDYTNHGIANDFCAAGLSNSCIVLGYKSPTIRGWTDFTAA